LTLMLQQKSTLKLKQKSTLVSRLAALCSAWKYRMFQFEFTYSKLTELARNTHFYGTFGSPNCLWEIWKLI
jgi:hypothetical protein